MIKPDHDLSIKRQAELLNIARGTREYTRSMYAAHASVAQRNLHSFEYRKAKAKFKDDVFKMMNEGLDAYKFDLKTSPKASVDTDIIITEDDIPVDSKGKGRQCFIKTEFALRDREHALHVLLLEEPEILRRSSCSTRSTRSTAVFPRTGARPRAWTGTKMCAWY